MVNGKWFLRTETDYWLLVIMQSFLNVFPQGIPPLYFVLYSLLSTLYSKLLPSGLIPSGLTTDH